MAANISAGYGDEDEALSGINVTPLVDVTLVLLIVFMITVPVIVGSARVKVDVPETTAIDADSEQLPLVFALKRNAAGDGTTLYLNDAPKTYDDVRTMFGGGKKKFNKDQAVSLSADKAIDYGKVMEVVNLLESLGLKKLSLDTRHVEPR